jgi:hypothetical protein
MRLSRKNVRLRNDHLAVWQLARSLAKVLIFAVVTELPERLR